MTETLVIVQTPFDDLSELANAFAQRVDEQHLVLPHREPVDKDQPTRFEVVLSDGSVALAGFGACVDCIDNGPETEPDRYDVVIAQLQLDAGISEVVFERMIMAREHSQHENPLLVESDRPVDVDHGDVVLAEHAEEEPDALASSATVVAAFDARQYDAEASAADQAAPARATLLQRATLAASWSPERDVETPPSRGQSAVFSYGDQGLPVPAAPPRPDGGKRIDPAPRPA